MMIILIITFKLKFGKFNMATLEYYIMFNIFNQFMFP